MKAKPFDRKAIIDAVMLIRAVEGRPQRSRHEVEKELDVVLGGWGWLGTMPTAEA